MPGLKKIGEVQLPNVKYWLFIGMFLGPLLASIQLILSSPLSDKAFRLLSSEFKIS